MRDVHDSATFNEHWYWDIGVYCYCGAVTHMRDEHDSATFNEHWYWDIGVELWVIPGILSEYGALSIAKS